MNGFYRWTTRAAAGVLFVAALAAGCAPAEEAQPPEEVSVEDVRYARLPGGARIVTGTLYNPTPDPIRNAQIQIALYDQNNRRVGSMNVLLKDISPGERKSFREPVESDEDVRGASVRSVLVL